MSRLAIGLIVAAAVALCALMPYLGDYPLHVIILVALYGSLAMSWNVLGGMSGQISLGHALFVGSGAYLSTALFLYGHVNPWLGMLAAVPLGAALGATIGYVVFSRQLAGIYFALVTLALSEMALFLVSNIDALGSSNGLSVPPGGGGAMMQFSGKLGYCYVILGLLAIVVAVSVRVRYSRLGYMLAAVRENERAAAALGINVIGCKATAAAISGALAAPLGGFYAQYVMFVDPISVMGVHLSVDALTFAFVGGVNAVFGPLLGAAVLVPLTEMLRAHLGGGFSGAHLIVYGAIIILVVRVAPNGLSGFLVPLARRCGARLEGDGANVWMTLFRRRS